MRVDGADGVSDENGTPSAGVKRVRKKPVEVEAMQWPGSATLATLVINWILENGGTARYHEERTIPASWPLPEEHIPESIAIDTLEGQMSASAGDWIIKGVKGEFYPCKPDIFAETYQQPPSLRARITVEWWDSSMNYALESIWTGEDPDLDTDEGRALQKAIEMHAARLAPEEES